MSNQESLSWDVPYASYYNAIKNLPVKQNIQRENSDLLLRRFHLYKRLGIPLRLLRGSSILEFGPGGGYNAIATSYFSPDVYDFVDASDTSISILNDHINRQQITARSINISKSSFLDFRSDKHYDLVICEGALEGQHQKNETLLHISSFVAPEGSLIVTSTCPTSTVADFCRRVLGLLILKQYKERSQQLEICSSLYLPGLSALGTNTRSVQDWAIDNVLHIDIKASYIFQASEINTVLRDSFEISASYPSVNVDGSWYKEAKSISQINNDFLQRWNQMSICFLDKRIPFSFSVYDEIGAARSSKISEICELLSVEYNKIKRQVETINVNNFVYLLIELYHLIPDSLSSTRTSIRVAADDILKAFSENIFQMQPQFSEWWGRAQHYIALSKCLREC